MGDDEASVLAHLSLLLSTQSLGFTDAGDAESTKELLAKMGGELEGVTVGEERGGGRGNSVRVEMPNRKTPYEVWAEGRQQEVVRTPPKLKATEFDSLVSKLHSSNKHKEQTIMARSNANLAEELRELNFKPELNRKSIGYTKSRTGKLEDRQEGMIQKRNDDMEKQRKLQRELEMKECTFNPSMEGKSKGQKYLKKSGSGAGGVSDMLRWEKEKRTRLAQRTQIVEEMEERELSFSPHLNRRSMMIADKMQKDGRLTFNRESGQTVTTPRAHAERTGGVSGQTVPGHEEETFRPTISARAAFLTPNSSKPVHARLYDHAINHHVTKHNEQLEMKKSLLNGVPMAKWEAVKMEVGGESGWVKEVREGEGRKVRERGESKDGSGMMIGDGAEAPINVLEYNPKYNFILEKIRFGGE